MPIPRKSTVSSADDLHRFSSFSLCRIRSRMRHFAVIWVFCLIPERKTTKLSITVGPPGPQLITGGATMRHNLHALSNTLIYGIRRSRAIGKPWAQLCRLPVAGISSELSSNSKEQAPQCGVATIEFADRRPQARNLFLNPFVLPGQRVFYTKTERHSCRPEKEKGF